MAYNAKISISTNPDGWFFVEAGVDADSEEEAFSATKRILDRHTAGVTHVIRMGPEARSDTHLETGKTHHKGYVRFCFKDEPGVEIDWDIVLRPSLPIK